jgi:HTH-type transcriptional regulator/antitoxin HigA
MSMTFKPFKNIGPGDLIKEELEAKKWVQEDLAYVLDISLKHLNEIINNKKAITLDLARQLGKVFNKNAQYWLSIELEYRQRIEASEKGTKTDPVEQKAWITERLPINEMFKKGWLERTNDVESLIEQVKRFLDNKKELDFTEFEAINLPPFSKSTAFKQFNPNAAKAWFYMAKNSSKTYTVPKYNKTALEKLYKNLHAFTIKSNGVEEFLNELNSAGIKFLFLSHLQKTYLNGAAFIENKNPVIVYTGRHNRVDNFWFVISHEIAHILNHLDVSQNNCYFINIENANNHIEEEANEIAAKHLLQDEILDYFKKNLNYITEDRVLSFSKDYKIHPAVIVGILAFKDIISFVNQHRFNEPIKEKIPAKYMVENLA